MAKQKKQQSKLKRTLGWFKPTSPTKGALLFAIAFVVIGGGYAAYHAFAQTLYVRHGTADFDCYKSNHCYIDIEDPDGSKKYYAVAQIRPTLSTIDTGNGGFVKTKFYMNTPWSTTTTSLPIPTQLCAMLRAEGFTEGTWAYMKLNVEPGTTDGNSGKFYVPPRTTYKKYCMPTIWVPKGTYFGYATVENKGPFHALIVQSITLESD